MHGEIPAEVFGHLPGSLRDINISGGEPFLRGDLPDILAAIKAHNPQARLVVSTNGFQPAKTAKLLPALLAADPQLAVRVSIDGMDATHDRIRGIPGGFAKCVQTLEHCRAAGVRDLGIGFTMLDANVHELEAVHRFAESRALQLSMSRLPGSLAVATILTCTVFASATGFIGATVTLMGLLALPAMLRAGYDVKLSAGVITTGGCLGILIPPSVMLILYGATAQVSVVWAATARSAETR